MPCDFLLSEGHRDNRSDRLRQGPHAKERPAAARPPAKGRPAAARPPAKGRPIAARASPQWGGTRPRSDRKGVAYGQRHRPQGLPPARVVAINDSTCRGGARGGAGRRGGRPLVERLPMGKCSFAACTGQRQWRRWGQEGLRHSFGEKDDFAPLNLKNSDDCPQVQNSKNTINNSGNSEECPLI
ncbi:hypothetical protein B296_00038062 [Ensete ventricosum]|uniref:Uncharacterized protein n=1 Tax=Ensete ventricosum TaxID=4639 RepID=A0A426YGR7_ENSVE|nr:hypothetical protein B296_00038062 [Ensete ventricosum]